MSALSIEPTYPTFTDSDGSPLDEGYVWIGVAGSATPIANPQTAYWDAALTQVVTQPVRTRGGYPLNAGAIGRLYVNGDYSIAVANSQGSVMYSAPNATERISGDVVSVIDSSQVTFLQAGTGAVTRTAQSKMRDVVSVFDFMTAAQIADVQAGTALIDVTAAIQAALTAATGKRLYFPVGTYKFSTITVPADTTVYGDGIDTTLLDTTTTGNAVSIGERNTFKDLTIQQTSGTKQGKGIVGSDKYWLMTENVKVLGFDYGLYCDKALYHSHKQSLFESCNYGCYYWGNAGAWNTDWFNNVITFDTCRFNGNTNIGAYIKGTEVVFINPDWTGMSATNALGLKVLGESGNVAHGIKIITPYSENTDIVFSFVYAYVEIDGGFVQGGSASGASAATSIIDADNSTVYWNGRMRDQDYWDYGYRLTNSSNLTFERGFSGSVRASNSVDGTSKVTTVPDYEEGTWTPSVGGTATYTTQEGRYTKVGRLVTASGYLVINAIGTGSTTRISGLPYTPAGVANFMYGGSVALFSGSATSVTALFARVVSGTAAVDLRATTAAQTSMSTVNILTSGTDIRFTVQYEV